LTLGLFVNVMDRWQMAESQRYF